MADHASPATTAAPGGAEPSRRDFIYIATGAVGAVGAVAVVWPLIDQMAPAADTLALSSAEYDVSTVPEGQQVVGFYRGKPLFIRHRTAAEIAAARKDDGADMRDPATDAQRVMQSNGAPGKEEYLIVEASCTHFGCVPTFGGGPYGGWLCACHGSIYDTAARIRGGPAPENLHLPPYIYKSDAVVKIG